MQISNTLSGKKETFTPLKDNHVNMYICGPTVYGLTHIGNARPPIFFNVVRQFFEFKGFEVKFVSNFTDVDDKIINKAKEENIDACELAEKYSQAYIEDIDSLGLRQPDAQPKVTETIAEIISFIEGLIKKGAAYQVENGEVFFSVRNFKEYGKLSKKNIDDLISGARVAPGELKKDPLDFSLWKPQKTENEIAWDSPWGKGRPGWHIECSVMSISELGESFDIHGGGMDLIHPHHENEIAQSEALSGKPYVKYWMHSNMLNINSTKMSKSLGNIFITRDFVKTHSAEVLKYLILSGHYRSVIDFSPASIKNAQCSLHRIYTALELCVSFSNVEGHCPNVVSEETQVEALAEEFESKWVAALEDDFNTPKVFSYVFDYLRAINAYLNKKGLKPTERTSEIAQEFLAAIEKLSSVLNLYGESPSDYLKDLRERVATQSGITPQEIDDLIEARKSARSSRDFAKADSIRDELLAKNICLKDSPTGTEWDIILS